jgi:hypothetical protein
MVLFFVALAYELANKQVMVVAIPLWVLGLLILANPYLLFIPFGTGLVNNFAVFIALYVPVSLVSGLLVGRAVAALWRWRRMAGRLMVAGFVICSCVWGALERVRDSDRAYQMVSQEDVLAMDWISEYISPDAKFLVNGFLAYGGRRLVGADAGWWIPLWTGRENTVPPLTYGLEAGYDRGAREQMLQDWMYLRQELPSSESVQFLRQRGVTHVYVGQGNGLVGNPGESLVDTDELLESPFFDPVYRGDGVWIWQIVDD